MIYIYQVSESCELFVYKTNVLSLFPEISVLSHEVHHFVRTASGALLCNNIFRLS